MTGAPTRAGIGAECGVLVLTDRRACAAAGHDLVEVCTLAVRAGADAVLVREKDLPYPQRLALVRAVVAAVGRERTLVAEEAAPAPERWEAWIGEGVAGLHLAAHRPHARPHGGGSPAAGTGAGRLPFGRSCHDELELAGASAEGADWVTVSPVAVTTSKPGYGPALGPAGLARLIAEVPAGGPAVVALGGVDAGNAAACLAAGASAVAVMGTVMRADDPAAVVSALVAAVASA